MRNTTARLKQQDGLRYSARDLSLFGGRGSSAYRFVLGSATPAFESLNNALAGRYLHAGACPSVPAMRVSPRCGLIDLRQHAQRDGLSQPLLTAMRRHLEADGQVLIYLNRRGYAPALLCVACGHDGRLPPL